MYYLWPIKTGITVLDVWSIAHLAFWIFIGSGLWAITRTKLTYRLISFGCCLAVAYGWEIFERYAEKHWPQYWLNPESPLNSWVSDPLMCVIGVWFMWLALDHWRK